MQARATHEVPPLPATITAIKYPFSDPAACLHPDYEICKRCQHMLKY